MRSARLLIALLFVVCFIFSLAHGETSEGSNDGDSATNNSPKIVFPRRRLLRKRINAIHDGTAEGGNNVTTSVSVSVSQSASETSDSSKPETITKSEKPRPKFLKSDRPRIKFVKPEGATSKFIKSERPLPKYLKTTTTTTESTTPTTTTEEPISVLEYESEPDPDPDPPEPQPKPKIETPRPKFVMAGRPSLKPKLRFFATASTTKKPVKQRPESVETEPVQKIEGSPQKSKPNFFKSNRTFSKFVKPEKAQSLESPEPEKGRPSFFKSNHRTFPKFGKQEKVQSVESPEPEKEKPKFFKSSRPLPSFLLKRKMQAEASSSSSSVDQERVKPTQNKNFKPSNRPFQKFVNSERFVPPSVKTDRVLQESADEYRDELNETETELETEQEPEPELEPEFEEEQVETTTKSKFLVSPRRRPPFLKSKPFGTKLSPKSRSTETEVDQEEHNEISKRPAAKTATTANTLTTALKPRLNLFSRFQNRPKLSYNNKFNSNSKNQIITPVPTVIGTNTAEPLNETPNSSFRPKARPNFGRAPTNRPIVKSTLKKLFRPTLRTTAASNYEEAIAEDEAVPEYAQSTTSPTSAAAPTLTTTPAPAAAVEISDHQRTGTQSTTNTISPTPDSTLNAAASHPTEVSSRSTSAEVPHSVETKASLKNKNMIIIPVPPSQRKPYHPVIMQVTKTPAVSSTEKPQTKVVTYKLNKMFVPMGIYGKVLHKGEYAEANSTDADGTGEAEQSRFQQTADVITGTSGQQSHNNFFPSSTISPSIRHKGSSEEQMTSGDSSADFSAAAIRPAIPVSEADSVFAAQEWRPAFSPHDQYLREQESKQNQQNSRERDHERPGKQYFDASTVDLTTNYKPDISSISFTTQKTNIRDISLTSTETPAYLGTSLGQGATNNRRENYKNQNSMFQMGPPRPFDKNSNRPNSLMDSIKNAAASAASSIPGFIHGGLTQLSQLSQPFEDTLFGGSTQASPVKSNPGNGNNGNGQVTLGAPDDETLEYFRKRPHLLNKGYNNRFNQPSYSSGFKPVTAPAHFAKSYYASTTTSSPSKSEQTYAHPSSTTSRPSYDEPIYESHKPSLLTRAPKNAQDWKDSYVDQLLESSHKFKYASTASPTEADIIRTHWREMSQKYTKNEIDEATNRIYSLMTSASSNSPALDELLYMKPPGQGHRNEGQGLSRSSSTSAFHDLLKMFRLGVTYGSFSSTSKPYEATVGNLRSRATVHHTGGPELESWRPIKSGREPFVSFNAGISFGPTPTPSAAPHPRPTPVYSSHGGTHYSSSSRPFIPGQSLKNSHSYLKSSGSGSSGLSSYFGSALNSYNKGYRGYPSSSSSHTSSTFHHAPAPKYPTHPPSQPDFSDVYYGSSTLKGDENGQVRDEGDENGYKPPANLASLYQNDPGLEIIPSSVYYKQKEQGIIHSGEIAAVLKPSDMSDESLKAQIPGSVGNLPQISYPSGKAPQSLQTLDQVNSYFQNSEPTLENQVHFQPPLYRLIQQSLKSQDSQLAYHQQSALQSHQQGGGHQVQSSYKTAGQQEEDSSPSQSYYEAPQEAHHHHHSQSHQLQYQPPPTSQSETTVHHHHVHKPAEVQHHYQPQPNHYQLPQQQAPAQPQQHQYQVPQATAQPQQHQYQLAQVQQQHQHQYQQPQAQHHQQQSGAAVAVKATGDSGLGFSDFELPAGVDPDIAALLKAELDKDDIPEEFRKEFAEQEKNKQKPQQQQQQHQQHIAASSTSAVIAKAPAALLKTSSSVSSVSQSKSISAQRREDVLKTVFHKPIPISPTLLTPVAGKTKVPVRVPSTIPRYVIDLARKLKNDRDLQGIVRVTSKKEGQVPIEYLYPVRG